MNPEPKLFKRVALRLFGERCETRDKDCPTCFVYELIDEIEKLRKEKSTLQIKNANLKKAKERFDYVCEENRKIARLVTSRLNNGAR